VVAFRHNLKADNALSALLEDVTPPWHLYAEMNGLFIAAAELCRLAGRQKTRKSHDTYEEAHHSADFRSVIWFGQEYTFTANQAACIQMLWEAWENDTPEVSGAMLLENADIDQKRLSAVFRDHPAWQTMICPGRTKGAYRLSPPAAHRKAPKNHG